MTTADALLAAVIATPDDELVRLVYADYVEENGDAERGELIRVQCELEHLPEWDRHAAELRHRERVLLARHGRRWLDALPQIDRVKWGEFRRGFVSDLIVPDVPTLIACAEQAVALTPLSGISLDQLPARPPSAVALPWLRQLRLQNREEFRAEDFERLLDSPLGEHLIELNLAHVGVENAGAEAIARATGLKKLARIDFSNCFVGVAGVRALAGAKHLAGLTSLRFFCDGSGYVDDPFVTHPAVEFLTDSPTFAHLTHLDVGGNNPTTESVQRILSSPNLARLEQLHLSHVGGITADAFAPTGSTARLKVLNLRYVHADDHPAMVAAVAESPQLSQLESLHLGGHQLNPSAVARLADSPLAESLRVLRLSVCGLDADAMQMLADGRWPNLHRLDLPGNRFEEVGAIFLAGSDGFPVLRSLNLGNCKLGTAGGVRLLGAGWFAGLRELNLSRNGLSAAFALAFVEKPPRRLCRLNLSNNGFGFESAHVLCAADLPELTDLNLSHNKGGGNAAADGLSKSGRMETLLTLNMDNTGMSGGAIWRLADRPAPQFSRLSVSNNILGDGGARALAKAEWPVLRDLLIMTCNIGADGMSAIAEAPFFARLRQVGFYGNRLPTTGPAAQVFAQGYWITGSDPTWLNDAPGDDE